MNGNFFSGSNVGYVNGRLTNVNHNYMKKKINERKSVLANSVKSISIDSSLINIHFSISKTSNIETHLYGEVEIDGDINYSSYVENNTLKITAKHTGNCHSSSLVLVIAVPQEKIFDFISVKSSSGNISLVEYVSANSIVVDTFSGNLKSSATFSTLHVSTKIGNVKINITANQDINVKISTVSGNISAQLSNIRQLSLSTDSKIKRIRNSYHNEATGYIANCDVSTMSGNITIR